MEKAESRYVKKVRDEYAEKRPDKLDEFRALDKKAKLPAAITAYVLGIMGALMTGAGVCLILKIFGASLSFAMPLGIAAGCAGIVLLIADAFIYRAVLRAGKRKYGAKIVALGDELLGDRSL